MNPQDPQSPNIPPQPNPAGPVFNPAPDPPQPPVAPQGYVNPVQPAAAPAPQVFGPGQPQISPAQPVVQPPAPQLVVPSAPQGLQPPVPQPAQAPQSIYPTPVATSGQAAPGMPGQPTPGQPYSTPVQTGFSSPKSGLGAKLKSKPKLLAGTILGVATLGIAAAAIVFVLPGLKGLPLETYSTDNYSLLVPKDYERKDEVAGGLSFEEKEGTEDTKSSVVVTVEKSPEKITKDEQDQVLLAFDEGIKSSLESEVKEGNTLEDYKAEKTTYKNSPARIVTANVKDKGKQAGKMKVLVGVSDSAVFVIGVLAHDGDKGLSKNTDKIINSLQLK